MSTATTHAGHDRLADRALRGDREAAAALAVLDSPVFRNDNRAWSHVDTDGIHWHAIIDEGTWSTGERVLLSLGRALWSGNGHVDVTYLFTCLSDGFLQVAVDAITARRGYQPLPTPRGATS